MPDTTNHIISAFRWQTSFDEKENAVRLQDRLSSWSKAHLPKELSRVFDAVCPPDQTWRIQSLEVDLGEINFSSLEREITERFYGRLSEKLTSLLLYANKAGHNIEILNNQISQDQIISSFLLNGYMPWTYSDTNGSINEVLAGQLHNRHASTVALLKTLAAGHENARKRLAWQVSESNITLFIRGVEPGDYTCILSFADVLATLQQKEMIVKTSSNDFRKNLWLWILNYLFTDRGSLFNKVAFLKSNIRQMAGHYNVSYHEILAMIERAAGQISGQYNIQSGFLSTLGLLLKEDRTDNEVAGNNKEKKVELQSILANGNGCLYLRNTASGKEGFNQFLIRLVEENSTALRQFFQTDEDPCRTWLPIIPYLKAKACRTLFTCFRTPKAAAVVQRINFLLRLCGSAGLSVIPGSLWQSGFVFLQKQGRGSAGPKVFLKQSICTLGRQQQMTTMALLTRLLGRETLPIARTAAMLPIHEELTHLFVVEIIQRPQVVSGLCFRQLLLIWQKLLAEGKTMSPTFTSLQQTLIKSIRHHPVESFTCLKYCLTQNSLQFLAARLDEATACLLLKQAAKKVQVIFEAVRQLLQTNAADELRKHAPDLNAKLVQRSLQLLLANPYMEPGEFARSIAKRFAGMPPFSQVPHLRETLRSWVANTSTIENLFEKADTETEHRVQQESFFGEIDRLMLEKADIRAEVSSLLQQYYHKHGVARLRRKLGSHSGRIINYLVPNGTILMDQLVSRYKNTIQDSLALAEHREAIKKLQDTFWKSLLDFSAHNGNASALTMIFSHAIYRQVSCLKINRKAVISSAIHFERAGNNAICFGNGTALPFDRAAAILKQCLTAGKTSFLLQGMAISFNELLLITLEKCPEQVTAALKQTPSSMSKILLLQVAIPFNRFIQLSTRKATAGIVKEVWEAIGAFYQTTTRFLPPAIAESLTSSYWQLIWEVVRSNRWSATCFKKLMQPFLPYLGLRRQSEAGELIATLQSQQLPLFFRQTLAGISPVFIPLLQLPEQRAWQEKLQEAEHNNQLDNLISSLINNRQVPGRVSSGSGASEKGLLAAIATQYPDSLLQALKQYGNTAPHILWLSRSLRFGQLIRCIERTNRQQAPLLGILKKLYTALGTILLTGIAAKEMQCLLVEKVISAWINDHWKSIAPEQIWNEMIWEASIKKGIAKKDLLTSLQKEKACLPHALQRSLDNITIRNKPSTRHSVSKKPVIQNKLTKGTNVEKESSWPVKNAGLVLVSSYIQLLFKRLGIIESLGNAAKANEAAASDAVHYLQYIANGLCTTEEHLLALNKLLCGIPLHQPVYSEIEIPEGHKTLVNEMLLAIIGYWPAIGACSVEGFRGNWLVRDGLLTEKDDRWELTIEKRAYDLLLNKSPFSFSIIKYPWMPKPLHVNWPY